MGSLPRFLLTLARLYDNFACRCALCELEYRTPQLVTTNAEDSLWTKRVAWKYSLYIRYPIKAASDALRRSSSISSLMGSRLCLSLSLVRPAVTLAAAHYQRAEQHHINDSLQSLVDIWASIIEEPERLACAYEKLWCEQMDSPREYYDEVRSRFNADPSPEALLFLLARCVKNAVRFNAAGEFNQSPDRRRRGTRPERMRKHIFNAHQILKGRTSATALDYPDILCRAKAGDLVYMDSTVPRDKR